MDIPAPKDRLQPALLDRLIDTERGQAQEPREARLVSRKRLREAVLRDLAWLLNTTRLGGDAEFGPNAEARRSVLNYGLPPLSGLTTSTLDLAALEQGIRQAIVDYEPRIAPASLRVQAQAPETLLASHNIVSIEIRGTLLAQPVPLELLLRTDVDLETGVVELRDLGNPA
ncbi:MAG: type VI secretion system baseplate subunit TssE [Telluria sp.]